MVDNDRKLRILSLDGGGFRGLSSLLILQSMMEMIKRRIEDPDLNNIPVEPRPCDYFDYIIGTGIGGVIALLLGRLKFTIPKCILVYRHLSLVLRDEGYSPLFDMDKLLLESKRIVDYYKGKTDDTETAETIVFAVERFYGPRCIYSIDPELSDLNPETPIHELIAALMAAKGLFREHTIKSKVGYGHTFLDRPFPFGYSNPATEAIHTVIKREQHKALRSNDSPYEIRDAILVSIGTGKVAKEDIGDLALLGSAHGLSFANPLKYFVMAPKTSEIVTALFSPDRILGSIAKDQEYVLQNACYQYQYGSQHRRCKLYRFEIGPVRDVGPSNFRSVKEVGEQTDQYLNESRERLKMVLMEMIVGNHGASST
ncbi:hypothetical protein GGI35DRAFT_434819 [Trichoderma velutinum]